MNAKTKPTKKANIPLYVGIEFVGISIFSLLRYISFVTKVVPQNFLKTIGINTKPNNSKGVFVRYAKLKVVEKKIQKANVQIRSLVSQLEVSDAFPLGVVKSFCFIKSCMIKILFSLFNLPTFILPQKPYLFKKIRYFFLIVLGFLCINITSFAYVEDYSREEISSLITEVERAHKIPSGILLSIVRQESNFKPYVLNVLGKAINPRTIEEAANIIKTKIASGTKNIDIGVAQINYAWHGKKFKSVEEMLDLRINLNYAANLLVDLKSSHGTWHKAIRYYHSSNSVYYKRYSRKVVLSLLTNNEQIK